MLSIFIVVAVILLAGWFLFIKNKKTAIDLTTEPSPASLSGLTASPEQSAAPALPEKVLVTMETARGNVELELYSSVAPKTVLNFLSLAEKGFYDGTKFHRVVPDFVIQGGDPLSKTDDPQVGTGGPGYQFEDEINPKSIGVPEAVIKQYEAAGYKYDYDLKSLPNNIGALSMANAGPNTNGSQFFIITVNDQPFLNGKHTVFGKVVKGMDAVLKIKQGDAIKSIKFKI